MGCDNFFYKCQANAAAALCTFALVEFLGNFFNVFPMYTLAVVLYGNCHKVVLFVIVYFSGVVYLILVWGGFYTYLSNDGLYA